MFVWVISASRDVFLLFTDLYGWYCDMCCHLASV